MRICYLGEIKSIIKNLQELGVEISFQPSKKCDGIIVTDSSNTKWLSLLRKKYNIPIIVKAVKRIDYHEVNVLILDESEVKEFYNKNQINNLKECKDKLKELKIHYLVVALTKEQIEEHVKYNLPKATAKDIKITKEKVATAKDNLTAIVGYIYIKEGNLSTEAIKKANIGAALSVVGTADNNLKDYYLDIKFKK